MKPLLLIGLLALMVQRAPQNQTGVIEGRVTRTDATTPVSGVRIEVQDAFPSSSLRTPFSAEATTDGGGRFTIRDVPAGNFNISASHDGYLGKTIGTQREKVTTAVSVAAGQRVEVPRLELIASATIQGRVTDRENQPIADLGVQILQRDV